MAQTAQQKIKSRIKRAMKALGTYKSEFDVMIEIYSDILLQYEEAMKMFEAEGRRYEAETAAGGTKKSGTVSALENLRKDIVTYSDRLGLNPKSLETMTVSEKKTSPIGEAIKALTKELSG